MEFEKISPAQIETRSFAIIESEMKHPDIPEPEKSVLMRVIHTTADFDYEENLVFTPGAASRAIELLRQGTDIVTDTNMARAGIHKASLAKLGAAVHCFMGDADVAAAAKARGCTRSAVCMEKAAALGKPLIFAIGNAPTALIRLSELMQEGRLKPALVIGVPVGFVNAAQSKELILQSGADCIVARGRKGGSNVAAAICNALIYKATGER